MMMITIQSSENKEKKFVHYAMIKTGACAKHQRDITLAVKRARHIAILPYTTKDQ